MPANIIDTQIQVHDIVLGSLPLKAKLNHIYYYKKNNKYRLVGTLRSPGGFDTTKDGVVVSGKIKLVRNSDTSFLSNIKQNGKFKVDIEKRDSLIFSSDVDEYRDLYLYFRK